MRNSFINIKNICIAWNVHFKRKLAFMNGTCNTEHKMCKIKCSTQRSGSVGSGSTYRFHCTCNSKNLWKHLMPPNLHAVFFAIHLLQTCWEWCWIVCHELIDCKCNEVDYINCFRTHLIQTKLDTNAMQWMHKYVTSVK